MEELEFLSGFAHIGAAVFVEAEDFSLVGPGRGRESGGTREALFWVDFRSGFGIDGGEISTVEQDVELIPIEEGRGIVGGGFPVAPGNEIVGGVFRVY